MYLHFFIISFFCQYLCQKAVAQHLPGEWSTKGYSVEMINKDPITDMKKASELWKIHGKMLI